MLMSRVWCWKRGTRKKNTQWRASGRPALCPRLRLQPGDLIAVNGYSSRDPQQENSSRDARTPTQNVDSRMRSRTATTLPSEESPKARATICAEITHQKVSGSRLATRIEGYLQSSADRSSTDLGNAGIGV